MSWVFLQACACALLSSVYVKSGLWRRLLRARSNAHPSRHLPVDLPARMLGWLERHHVPGFNSSCLYRSVAVCLFVRSSGGSAVLRIGAAGSDVLKAHAWVENEHGELLYEEREGWAVLQP